MAEFVAVRPQFADIIDPKAEAERIATGFLFTEGPVWHSQDRSLTFSDIRDSALYVWREDQGAQVFRKPSGVANGNTYDHQGRLLSCEHANRRVSRTKPDGTIESVVDSYEGKRLNSPNDLVCASNGDIYFTDPPYGLRRPDGSIQGQELPFNGVFRWSAETKSLTLLVDDFERPNGLVLSDDESRLYIADTQTSQVRVFDIDDDGQLRNGREFLLLEHEGVRGRPDGMKMDSLGNLYVTSSTPQGVWVYDPDGRLLGQIGVGENPANVAFGGDDWSSLFVTAQTSVYRVRLKVSGQRVRLE